MEHIRYPIGKFEKPTSFREEDVKQWISDIRMLPKQLREAVSGLNDEQLNTPYREGGWTVAQVVHHLADANMNAFIRTKLIVTEELPTVKPFEENDWAETAEARAFPIESSLKLLEGLHERWTALLESLPLEDFKRKLYHPAMKTELELYTCVAMFAWHGKHHVAHIRNLRTQKGW
ncbi:YfiT family bacillithiol transferase [Thermaerobacillus caldiproteolyticus]|uniref:Putative metal-dependent hydrolase HNR31_001530 n=1 Tax=Thermaerobacillus caldiproteolyticus TaxID=247480 RepID=A0A7V9Z674_9BACL|nr:putative metal-dependent hydrolase [Anoxybacillus caldiproteolyticus]MBA2874759.1 putative damage-inducible protein DinB [Anoxybacillus caldiproteolyticus]QPA31524.1 putative metal-dependent hydrolase [Anoxybacillus caldiproteolyticus]